MHSVTRAPAACDRVSRGRTEAAWAPQSSSSAIAGSAAASGLLDVAGLPPLVSKTPCTVGRFLGLDTRAAPWPTAKYRCASASRWTCTNACTPYVRRNGHGPVMSIQGMQSASTGARAYAQCENRGMGASPRPARDREQCTRFTLPHVLPAHTRSSRFTPQTRPHAQNNPPTRPTRPRRAKSPRVPFWPGTWRCPRQSRGRSGRRRPRRQRWRPARRPMARGTPTCRSACASDPRPRPPPTLRSPRPLWTLAGHSRSRIQRPSAPWSPASWHGPGPRGSCRAGGPAPARSAVAAASASSSSWPGCPSRWQRPPGTDPRSARPFECPPGSCSFLEAQARRARAN